MAVTLAGRCGTKVDRSLLFYEQRREPGHRMFAGEIHRLMEKEVHRQHETEIVLRWGIGAALRCTMAGTKVHKMSTLIIGLN